MTGNILGESVLDFVQEEATNRQKILGKGIDGTERKTATELHYINNRNTWVKLASSVSIVDDSRLPFNIGSSENLKGLNLAKKSVLFNGLSSLNDDKTYNFRSGVATDASIWNDRLYGLGGTAQGIQPAPGIKDINVVSKNNGAIRNATINIVAYNRFQFELIELLYLRLGFTLLLEFGWNSYLDKDGKPKKMGSTLVENEFFKEKTTSQMSMLGKIQQMQETYNGNYDGFFGRVKNFTWDFKPDGTYSIRVDLISLGDVIEALKVNIPPTESQRSNSSAATKSEIETYGEPSDSVLLANKNSNRLSAYFYNCIQNKELFKNNANYFNLAGAVNYRDSDYNFKKIDRNYNYFVSFGELISVLEREIIPNISPSDKQLVFDAGAKDTTLMNYTPNLISFNPKVCIFKYDDGTLNQADIKNVYVPQYTKSMMSAFSILGKKSATTPKADLGTVSKTPPAPLIGAGAAAALNFFSKKPPVASTKLKITKYDQTTETITLEGGISFPIDANGNAILPLPKDPNAPSYKVDDINKLRGDSSIKEGSMVFLKLYSMYINIAHIFESLSKNYDKDGNLSIYKFLQEICDGINSSLANITKIEPYIKDDKIVTFLERKPPQGLSKNLSKIPGVRSTKNLELQVFGFDKSKNESNFLKNIKFNTKITPMLANQISIGATASGTTVGEDATAFSKWNNGLVDRFQQTITTPETTTTPTATKTTDVDTTTENGGGSGGGTGITKLSYEGNTNLKPEVDSNLKKILNNAAGSLLAEPSKFPLSVTWNGKVPFKSGRSHGSYFYAEPIDQNHVAASERKRGIKTIKVKSKSAAELRFKVNHNGIIQDPVQLFFTSHEDKIGKFEVTNHLYNTAGGVYSNNWLKHEISKPIEKKLISAYGAPTEPADSKDSNPNAQKDAANQAVVERLKKIVNVNYSAYLSQMFGGTPSITEEQQNNANLKVSTISKANAQYLPTTNNEYIEMGKGVYKNYLEKFYGKFYSETGIPSNAAGFIPVEFNLDLDGISGFRMFNRIDIQQSFLPKQYSATLEFLITGISHKITDKGWVTNLKTLSTSNIDKPPSIKFNPAPVVKANSGGTGAVDPNFDPGTEFTKNRSAGNAARLKSDPSVPVENGYLHRYPGMLVEADAALYARLKMRSSRDNKRFRLHYACMPHFKTLLNAYETAVSSNGKTFLERYGKLQINSAYRSVVGTPNSKVAAPPGKSRHGLGVAVDLQQPSSYAEVHTWFRDIGKTMGWMRIPLINNGTTNEKWHWECQFTGKYQKIDSKYFGKGNIKKDGKNGKKQYAVKHGEATGVEKIKETYILDKTVWEKQKKAQIS